MPAATMIALLALTLIVTAITLWRLPVGTCSQCEHCRTEELLKEREEEAMAGRFYGIPLCPSCGRYHAREEPHRR